MPKGSSPDSGGESGPPTAHWSTSELPTLSLIRERLAVVFPEGIENRGLAIAERAAKSLFVFLYVYAVEGVSERRLRPSMVMTMSDSQAARIEPSERWNWGRPAAGRRAQVVGERWYAENSREGIRDETFRVWKEFGAL